MRTEKVPSFFHLMESRGGLHLIVFSHSAGDVEVVAFSVSVDIAA